MLIQHQQESADPRMGLVDNTLPHKATGVNQEDYIQNERMMFGKIGGGGGS